MVEKPPSPPGGTRLLKKILNGVETMGRQRSMGRFRMKKKSEKSQYSRELCADDNLSAADRSVLCRAATSNRPGRTTSDNAGPSWSVAS